MSLVIFTDCEPDDMLALWILERRGYLDKAVIVVTENDEATLKRKAWLVRQHHQKVSVQIGSTSSRQRQLDETYGELDVPRFAFGADAPLYVIALAPPRDLMAQWRVHPHYFKTSELWAYGGFNFRELVLGGVDVVPMLKSFWRAHIFETFHAVGARNFIEETPAAVPYLGKLARDWNRHIALDMQNELASNPRLAGVCDWARALKEIPDLTPSEVRCMKVLDVIAKYPTEIVAADPLVAVFFGTKATRPCTLSFAEGSAHTQLEPAAVADTTLYALFDTDVDEVWAKVGAAIQ